ncbi:MAG: aquaporin [SAR202 cluster bacterium]|nr:aquaporin [SAR202 cluster bacterium]
MTREARASAETAVDVRAALAEGLATLLFVFMGAGTVAVSGMIDNGALSSARLVAIAMAHGIAILIGVAAAAKLSGGHLNPAVTIAACLAGKIGLRRAGTYIAAQLAGAIIGAVLIKVVVPDPFEGTLGSHAVGAGVGVGAALVAEIVGTFALVWVVFAVAIDPKGLNTIAPIAVGLTILLIHLFLVPLTGAGVNPARSFGPALISMTWADHWVYWVGPIVGGSLAGLMYEWVFMNRGGGN